MNPIGGLHHITAMTKNQQTNLDFYRWVLGQRLVKTTVNFDDPSTYHLYYSDHVGTPGANLTFFVWQNIISGQTGAGETIAAAYNTCSTDLDYWKDRFASFNTSIVDQGERFGDPYLSIEDPSGMRIDIIANQGNEELTHWEDSPIDISNALQGFHSVTLEIKKLDSTVEILTDIFGYQSPQQENDRYRLESAGGGLASTIDLLHHLDATKPRFGAGSIHHIAFRVENDEEQLEYREALLSHGLRVTTVIDRKYFHSIYFRISAGVLFEIATLGPGFTVDESVDELGSNLCLPSWYEDQREEIAQSLPKIDRESRIQPI